MNKKYLILLIPFLSYPISLCLFMYKLKKIVEFKGFTNYFKWVRHLLPIFLLSVIILPLFFTPIFFLEKASPYLIMIIGALAFMAGSLIILIVGSKKCEKLKLNKTYNYLK